MTQSWLLRVQRSAVVLAWAVVLLGTAAVFGSYLRWMWRGWFPAWSHHDWSLYDRLLEGDSYYSHGPLVPLVSLALAVALMRSTPIVVRPRPILGLTLLAIILLLRLLAILVQVQFVCGPLLLGLVVALVLTFWGVSALRRLWFPIVFLVVMLPLSHVTIAGLNFRLRIVAADWGVWLGQAVGIPVERLASNLFLEGGKELVVGNVCSGLRTIITLMGFGAVYAYICRLRGLWRLGLYAMMLPVALASNAARILGLIVVAHVWDAGVATGWYHDVTGVMVFVLAFLLLYGIEEAILRIRRVIGRPAPQATIVIAGRLSDGGAGQRRDMLAALFSYRAYPVAGLMLLAIVGSWQAVRLTAKPWSMSTISGAAPSSVLIGDIRYDGQEQVLEDRVLTTLQTRDYISRRYTSGSKDWLDLVIIYSRDNRMSTHLPEICLESGDDRVVERNAIELSGAGGHASLSCRELVVQGASGQTYYLYTLRAGREYTANIWKQQAIVVWNSLTRGNATCALVRVSMRIDRDGAGRAREKAMELMRQSIAELDKHVP